MIIVKNRLQKAKYLKRWRGKDGKWIYKYSEKKDKSRKTDIKREIKSNYGLNYISTGKGKHGEIFDIKTRKGNKIGMVEYHKKNDTTIEIDRMYIDGKHQKQGNGQKIIHDLLEKENINNFELYPLDPVPWVKMGMVFNEQGNLYMNKKDFLEYNKNKLNLNKKIHKSIIVKTKERLKRSIIVKARDYKAKLQRLIVRKQNNIASPAAEYDHSYKLQDRMNWHGLNIAIENKKGSYRKGKDPDGKPWKTYMNFDYGRIVGTKATDSEAVDAFIGPDDTADLIYVVHQQDPFKKCYDEDKVLIQFPSKDSAIEGFLSQYDRPDFLGPVSEFTIPEFKIALKEKRGTMLYKSPYAFRKSRIIVRVK